MGDDTTYSVGLHERLVRQVEAVASVRAVARCFAVSVSLVVKLMQTWRRLDARPHGGDRRSEVLELIEGEIEHRDVLGEIRAGRQRLIARGLVVGGRWWHPPRT